MNRRTPTGSVQVLKRTDFSSRGEIPDQIKRIRREPALSGALRVEKRYLRRRIIAFFKL
jgi:hypothetical protein